MAVVLARNFVARGATGMTKSLWSRGDEPWVSGVYSANQSFTAASSKL
jgi:hypothetical protein